MPKEFEWKDYEQFFCILRDKLSLNEDRVYLDGQCGNGISAMALALKYPDQWAECAIRLGNSYRHLAGNAWNLPLIFVRWDNNEEHLVSYYDFAVKSFLCRNPKDFKFCVSGKTVVTVRGKPIPDNLRIKNPSRVLYTIESLANPSAYWVQIDGREDENFIASINAIVCGQRILVKTDNVDAYTLNLELAPLDCLKPVEIIENNQRLDSVTGPVFVRKSPNHETFAYVKNKSLHGPICDVFTDAYTVLYTDGKDSNETEGIKAIAKQISGGGPCLPEDELSDEIIQNHNLIIVGRTGKCQFLSKISESLPLQISKSEIVFENQRVDGDVGLMMVYPNPKNSKKYIALILGGSSRVINNIPVIWENDLKNAQADIAIFKVGSDNKHKFIRLEKFSTIWSWHEQWSQPLTTVSKQHPKWRWRQWVGHVVRKQLDADIAICEDIFKGVEKPDQEKITLRDLDRIFKNKWFVKIKLNGKELKMLLTRNVAVKDISGSTAIRPVIDGISLIKGMGGSGYMHVSQIKEDQYYMVALPEKLVNGSRIGMILTDYEIVGDGYQIQLLQDYLKSRNNLELDSELKKMKLTIM